MRVYSNKISLTKNSRGVTSLDPTIGCSSGTLENNRGCYSDCYAARIAKIYGYDFTKTIKRRFVDESHIIKIRNQINKVKLPFIRMGTMGDPSEAWDHTISIIKLIQQPEQLTFFDSRKEFVIITKHWENLRDDQLCEIKKLKVCINTSVSALDNSDVLENSLHQYHRLKPFCRSILRIVSCDFNTDNELGQKYKLIQDEIFKMPVLDTVFRPSKNNKLILDGIINVKESKFLGKRSYISKANKKTYLGRCDTCLEMCGVFM